MPRFVRLPVRVFAVATVCFFGAIGLFVLPVSVVLIWVSLGLVTAGFVRTYAYKAEEGPLVVVAARRHHRPKIPPAGPVR